MFPSQGRLGRFANMYTFTLLMFVVCHMYEGQLEYVTVWKKGSAPWTAWLPPRYEGQGRNSGLWTCSLVQPRQIAWGDRVTRWLLKRVDCSSIALSCLFNNYPDSKLFSWCMLVCWCRSLHSFAMSCFLSVKAGSDQGFREVPLSEPPNHIQMLLVTLWAMKIVEQAKWRCPAVPWILRFDPSKKKGGAKADLRWNSLHFVLGPGRMKKCQVFADVSKESRQRMASKIHRELYRFI